MKEKLFSYISFYQWWKSIDKPILSLILILFSAGLFFSLVSTSLIASDKLDTNTYFFFFKHTVFVFFGFFLIFILSFIPEKEIYRISLRIFAGTTCPPDPPVEINIFFIQLFFFNRNSVYH